MEYIYLIYSYHEGQCINGLTEDDLYAAYSDFHNAERVALELYSTLMERDDEFFIGINVVRFPVDKINFANPPYKIGKIVCKIANPTHKHHQYDCDGYAFYHNEFE